MNDTPSDHYTPEKFFFLNSAYKTFKKQFDSCLSLFRESENLKDEITKIGERSEDQIACSLIFLRSQQLIISILRLANEGNAEDARILTRSLFEHYIHLKYIIKKSQGRLFLRFYWIASKRFFDNYQKDSPKENLLRQEELRAAKNAIDDKYNRVKNDFIRKQGKGIKRFFRHFRKDVIRINWSPKKLSAMSKALGEKRIHDFVMKNYSSYVHCDVFNMFRFFKEIDGKFEFENSPRPENMGDILALSAAFFGGIAAHLALISEVHVPHPFSKYL